MARQTLCALRRTRPVLWALGMALAGGGSPSAKAASPAARWVASDAAIYLEAPRPALLFDRLQDPSFQKALRAVPLYARFLTGDGHATGRAILDQLFTRLDTTWERGVRDLSGEGVVVAVEGEPGQPGRIIVIVTPRDPRLLKRAHEALLEMARADAAGKGKPDPVKHAEHRGITGYALEKGAYAIVKDSLVIVDRPDTLKIVIDRALDGITSGGAIEDNPRWTSRRERVGADALVWGFARPDRFRVLDPQKFTLDDKARTPLTLLFGSWLDAIRKADWASAILTWNGDRLGADVTVPIPPAGYASPLKGYLPPKGKGAGGLIKPPGMIASLSLWRDLAAVWEARTELFPPEVVQGLAKLDGVAGQFLGGRDFGTGVLGSLGNEWRLIVARQDETLLNPVPDRKLPAFALIVELKPDDDDFAQRLRIAFQSFVGLANLNAAQSKAPPLELGSETVEGVTIATSNYIASKTPPGEKEAVHQRHNFTPSAAQVDNHFILSSSIGLARDLVKALHQPSGTTPATIAAEADGPQLARMLEGNRARMVMQNMLEKGHDKMHAEEEVGLLVHGLRYLGHARLDARDGDDEVRIRLDFALEPPAHNGETPRP